ncbi:hypothetical protein BDW72DRAFT_206636 [Aspergillus terricola var. indicus]
MGSAPPSAESHQVQGGLARAITSLQHCRITSVDEDINAAVESAKAAVSALSTDGQEQAAALTVLAAAPQQRYRASSGERINDLDEAVDAIRAAVEAAMQEPNRADAGGCIIYFENLEGMLLFRYIEAKNQIAIEDSCNIANQLIARVEKGGQYQTLALKILCGLYEAAHKETEIRTYLEGSINAAERAVSIARPGSLLQEMLAALARLYDKRFDLTQFISDLDQSLAIHAERLRTIEDGPRKFIITQELSFGYGRRYAVTGSTEDMEKSIGYDQASIKIAPTAPTRGLPFSVRQKYFELTGQIADIEADLLEKLPILHWLAETEEASLLQRLRQVSDAFQRRYEISRRLVDLEYAIRATLAVFQKTTDEHAEWGALRDAFRVQLRLWSVQTGKFPESDLAILMLSNGGSYLPPEELEKLGRLRTPYMIYGGELPVEENVS